MKNVVFGALFLALIGTTLTFSSCEKNAQIDESPTYSIDDYSKKSINQTDFPIDFYKLDPSEIGRLHNVYLQEAIEGHYNNPNLSPKEITQNLMIDKLNNSQKNKIFNLICNSAIEEKEAKILEFFNEEKSSEYFMSIGNEINNIENYTSFSDKLDAIALSINADIVGYDKYILLSYLETSRHSAYFWLPTELGGSAKGMKYIIDNNINIEPSRISDRHKEILKADGVGAGFGMVGWGLSGMFGGPIGGVGGFVFGAIYGAVTASLQEGGSGGWGSSSGCC